MTALHRTFFGVAVFSVICATLPAAAATVDLSGQVNADLTTYSSGSVYPQNGGPITIGGIGFDLATLGNGHTGVAQLNADGTPQSFTITTNLLNVGTVYTIANSAFGASPHTAGQITFNTLGAQSFNYVYTEGDNIRDHATTGFNTVAPNIFASMDFGSGDRLDVQQIILPSSFANDIITSIVFSYIGDTVPGNGEAFLAAITTEAAVNPVPLPAALPLFSSGLIGLGWLARRRKKQKTA